jgi:hypothetical protein
MVIRDISERVQCYNIYPAASGLNIRNKQKYPFVVSDNPICYWPCNVQQVEASWNVVAQAQKHVFVFRQNGRFHLIRQGASVQSSTGSRGVRMSGSNAGYIMFRGSVKSTDYPLYSPVSPSLSHTWVTVCHHISTGVYHQCLVTVEFMRSHCIPT